MPSSRHRRRRRAHWAAYLWPGLPHLWIDGSVAGLVLALAFSVLLNLLILATLVWPEWLDPRLKLSCGLCAGGLWLAALWETRCELRRIAERREAEASSAGPTEHEPNTDDDWLRRAQASYLRAEWASAEREIRRALWRNRRDVEAGVWYATLLRRTGRERHARRRLRRLELLDGAAAWRHEIRRELERLDPPTEAMTSEPQPEPTSAATAPRAEPEAEPAAERRRAA